MSEETVGGNNLPSTVTLTEYFTSGGRILAEKTGSNVLWYIYDSDGEILGFTYNGTPYYYIKNVQGDVYKVVNASGSVVASYTYDAWGKVLSSTGSMAQINSIRYRSYYYDAETGFYYLQSRYYDPEMGRFLNADGLLGANQDLLSYNLYAYCSNNPVNCSDPTGWVALECAILGVVAVAFIGVGMMFGTVGAQVASQQLKGTVDRAWNSRLNIAHDMIYGSDAIRSAKTADDLTGVAQKYGNLKCKEAADEMQRVLEKNRQKGALIQLYFPNAYRGYVCCERVKNQAISYNGTHYGILYNGLVYCNIYPEGKEMTAWIGSFTDAWGSKPIVTEIPIG